MQSQELSHFGISACSNSCSIRVPFKKYMRSSLHLPVSILSIHIPSLHRMRCDSISSHLPSVDVIPESTQIQRSFSVRCFFKYAQRVIPTKAWCNGVRSWCYDNNIMHVESLWHIDGGRARWSKSIDINDDGSNNKYVLRARKSLYKN